MPFIYQTTFDIETKNIDELQIGRSLQLSLSYLKAFLPNEPGFINARAMYSITHNDLTHVSFESAWEDWETLETHREKSSFAEEKMLSQFEMKITPQNVITRVFEEIE